MAARRQRETEENSGEAPVSLAPLFDRLSTISRSLGVLALRISPKHPKNNTQRIRYLQGLGFDRNEIAGILGSTPGTVSVRLSERKRKRRRKR